MQRAWNFIYLMQILLSYVYTVYPSKSLVLGKQTSYINLSDPYLSRAGLVYG